KINYLVPGPIASCSRFEDSLFNSRNIILRDRTTKNFVYKFEFAATGQRLHLNFAISILSMSAGLLLVFTLNLGLPADGFSVRNLWSFQIDINTESFLKTSDYCFNVKLTHPGQQHLASLLITSKSKGGIFFQNFVEGITDLVLVSTRFGFNGKSD